MSIGRRLRSSIRFAITAEGVRALFGGLLIFLLARLLGAESYGILFLAIAVLELSKNVSTFGIHRSTARYISEFKERDPGQVRHIVRYSLMLIGISTLITIILLLVFRTQIARLVGEPALDSLLVVGVLYLLFGTSYIYTRLLIQSFEEIQVASTIDMLHTVSRMILAVGLVVLGFDAVGALVGYSVAFLFGGVLGSGYLYIYKFRGLESAPRRDGLRRRLARYTLPIAVTQGSHVLNHQIDKILIGFFIGPVGVAYYTLGEQIINFVVKPMSALGFALSPTYSAERIRSDEGAAREIYEQALARGALVYLPAATGLLVIADPLVRTIFGTEYLGAIAVLQILAILSLFKAVEKLTGEGLDYLGRARERAIAKLVTATLNFVLNLILIPLFGVVGAAVASVIAFFLYTALNVYVMHTELGLRVGWLSKQFGYAALTTGLMTVPIVALSGYATGIFSLLGVVFFGVGVWFCATLLLGLVSINDIRALAGI